MGHATTPMTRNLNVALTITYSDHLVTHTPYSLQPVPHPTHLAPSLTYLHHPYPNITTHILTFPSNLRKCPATVSRPLPYLPHSQPHLPTPPRASRQTTPTLPLNLLRPPDPHPVCLIPHPTQTTSTTCTSPQKQPPTLPHYKLPHHTITQSYTAHLLPDLFLLSPTQPHLASSIQSSPNFCRVQTCGCLL